MKYFVIEDGGRRFLVRADRRAGLPCVAVFSTSYRVDELINVNAVMRRQHGVEEWLDRDNVWRAEHRDLDGQVWLPVSEEEVERLQWTATMPDWFVVHDRGAYPYAVVRKTPSAEEAFTRALRWEPSDLLGREGMSVEKRGKVIPYDARAAIEIGVRAERQQARGGTEYFTLWDKAYFDPQRFTSAIRRTAAGEEIYVGHSGWVPARMLRDVEQGTSPFHWALPLDAEEIEAVIAGRSEPRCYHVLSEKDGRELPHAVVQVDGEHEEAFTRDLRWGPSNLLARLADEPGLWAQELLPGWTADAAAFRMADAVRRRRRSTEWAGEHWYFAVFSDEVTALDLANAHVLVRTPNGTIIGEKSYLRGAWSGSFWLEDINRGKADDVYLPISPDEAQGLMELRGGRRP